MYVDNRGIEHEDYGAACDYYGADRPEYLAWEAQQQAAKYRAEMEAKGYLFSADGTVMMAPDYANELMDRMSAGEVQPGAVYDDPGFGDIPIPF
jgi:hypothetical protein